jgi:phage-related protein
MVSDELLVKLKTVADMGGIDQLTDQMKSLGKDVNFDQLGDNYKEVTNRMATDSANASDIAATNFAKINLADFFGLAENFKQTSNSIGTDSQTASDIAVGEFAKINIANFDGLVGNFKQSADEIAKQSGVAYDTFAANFAKINLANFNGLVKNFKDAAGIIYTEGKNAGAMTAAEFAKLNVANFDGLVKNAQSAFSAVANDAQGAMSSVANDIKGTESASNSFFEGIISGASGAFGSLKDTADSVLSSVVKGFEGASSAAQDFLSNLQGVQGLATGAMGGLGLASVGDMVVGTTAKAEVNKVLLKNMTQTAQGAETLFNTLDKATDTSLVSLQSIVPAVNKLKFSANLDEKQLNAIGPGVAQFGSFVNAMTGSAIDAENAMGYLADAFKGRYATLSGYGITQESLMATGKWEGVKGEDFEGFMAAVQEIAGGTDELMTTFTGLEATIRKTFSSGAKRIGAELLPLLKYLAEGFLGLNSALGGWLTTAILVVVGAISAFLAVAGTLGALMPMITSGFGMMSGAVGTLTRVISMGTGALNANTIATRLNAITTKASAIATSAKQFVMGLLGRATLNTTRFTIANTLATNANTGATKAQTIGLKINTMAMRIHAFATSGNVLATIRATIAAAAHKVAMFASAAAAKVAAGAMWLLNAAMSANPYVLVAMAIIALIAILYYLYNTNEDVKNALDGVWNALVAVGQGIYSTIKPAIDWLVSGFQQLWDIISSEGPGALDGLYGALLDLWNALSNNPIAQFIAELMTWSSPLLILIFHFEEVKNAFNDVWNFINNLIQDNPLVNIISWISPIGILLFHLEDIYQMFQALGQAWNEFANSTAGTEFFDSLNSAFAEVQSAFGELLAAFGEIGAAFGSIYNALFPPEVAAESSNTANAVNTVTEAVKEVNPFLEAAKTVIQGFVGVVRVAGFIVQGFANYIKMWVSIFQAVAGALRAFAGAIKDAGAFISWLGSEIQNTGNKIASAIGGAWNNLINFFKGIWAKITNVFLSSFYSETGKWLGVIPGLWNLFVTIATSILNAALNVAKTVIGAVLLIGTAIYNGLLAIPGLVMSGLTALYEIGVSIGQTIYNTIMGIPAYIQGAWDNTVSFITSLPGMIVNALLGAFNSAKGSAESAVNSIDWRGILNGILDFILSIPGQILSAITSVISGGLDLMGMLGTFLFGEDIGAAFTEKSQAILASISAFMGGLITKITSAVRSAFNKALDIVELIGSFIFGGGEGSNITDKGTELLSNISSFFTELPSKIVELAKTALSGGIDVYAMVIGAIFGDTAGGNFSAAANKLLDALFNPDEWLSLIISGINAVVGAILGFEPIRMLIDAIFGEGASANLTTAITEFVSYLGTLPDLMFEALMESLTAIMEWGIMIWDEAVIAATGFVDGVISIIMFLPTQLWIWFVAGLGMITTFASNALSRAIQVGTNIINGIIDNVKKIPQMVYDELMRVGERILSAGSTLYQKARQVGEGIWKSIQEGLGIGSPGHIFYMIAGEMDRVIDLFTKTQTSWFDEAKDLGRSVIDGFNTPNLGGMLEGIDLNPLHIKLIGDTKDFLSNLNLDEIDVPTKAKEWYYRTKQDKIINPNEDLANTTTSSIAGTSESGTVVNDNRKFEINVNVPSNEITNAGNLESLAQLIFNLIIQEMNDYNNANGY